MTFPLFLIFLGSLLFLSALVGSGVIWSWVILRYRSGGLVLPRRFRSDIAPVPVFVLCLGWAYVLLALSQFLNPPESKILSPDAILRIVEGSIIEGIVISLLLVLCLLAFTNSPTGLYRLGFRGDHLFRQMSDGIGGFMAALLPVFGMILLSLPFRSLETTHPFLRLIHEQGVGSEFVSVFIAAVIIAPIKEELIFRVILQSGLVRWCGVNTGIFLTAALFAAVHGFPDALGLFPLALLLGIIYHRRRSVLTIVLMHALFNAFNLGLLLLQKYSESSLKSMDVLP